MNNQGVRWVVGVMMLLLLVAPVYAASLRWEITWDSDSPFYFRWESVPHVYGGTTFTPANVPAPSQCNVLHTPTSGGSTLTASPQVGWGPITLSFEEEPAFDIILFGRFAYSAYCGPRGPFPAATMTVRRYVDGELERERVFSMAEDNRNDPYSFRDLFKVLDVFTRSHFWDISPGETWQVDMPIAQHRADDPIWVHPSVVDFTKPGETVREPKAKVVASVWDGDGPVANTDLWLRVVDPPDDSLYVRLAGHNTGDDNLDPNAPKGYLEDAAGNRQPGGIPLKVTTNDAGRYEAYLLATKQFAGDNYRVEVGFDPSFSCAPHCPRTSNFVAKKRQYLEVNSMWRNSLILSSDAKAGTSEVFVNDISNFVKDDIVSLIHAPSFLRNLPLDSSGFYQEPQARRIKRVGSTSGRERERGKYKIVLDQALEKSYYTDIQRGDVQLGDAVVNLTRDAAGQPILDPMYRVTNRYGVDVFDDAHVELVVLPDNVVGVPHYIIKMEDADGSSAIVSKWMRSRAVDPRIIPENHSVVVAASERVASQSYGSSWGGWSASFLWIKRIETSVQAGGLAGLDAGRVASELLVHELAHQWDVNSTTGTGHCSQMSYDDPAKHCAMNLPNGYVHADDGHVAFHYQGTDPKSADSEYLSIRSFPEPKRN